MAGNDYQKSYSEQQYSYQVPSDSSYQTNYYQPQSQPQPQPSYSKPEVSYSSKPPPQPQQPAYQADSAYQQAPPPPPAAAYQKAPEPAYASKPQQQQYQPPPPPPKAADYQKPKGQQKPNPYVEVAGSLASQYPNSGEPLNLDLASTTSEAAGSAQDSQAALASVYGEIHRRMAELEQLQRYVASVQAEVQQAYTPIVIPQIYVPPMPTLSYSSVGPSYLEPQVPSTYYSPVPASNYPPPPPPPPPKPAAVSYSPPPPKQQEYKPQQQPSYSTPKPQPSYNTPKPSYSEPKNQPQQSYNSGQPYNGNQMTVQYVKTVEKVSQNATSPAAAAAY
ncbi:PREDICTED: extensin-like [Rhagoletis zephyria]|uniref:extensin-like n=1 Tax=Rhagoletis zephyria TaxID=28612 RepID=UPI000811A308|nr:PREDICTED: extensin-like [Rhagoletis zephyria]